MEGAGLDLGPGVGGHHRDQRSRLGQPDGLDHATTTGGLVVDLGSSMIVFARSVVSAVTVRLNMVST